jgi:hypothetical protein
MLIYVVIIQVNYLLRKSLIRHHAIDGGNRTALHPLRASKRRAMQNIRCTACNHRNAIQPCKSSNACLNHKAPQSTTGTSGVFAKA